MKDHDIDLKKELLVEKKIFLALALMPSAMYASGNIKPLIINKAVTSGGTLARNYIVVHTVIQKNPDKADSRPIVDRSVIGNVPVAINKMLKVPEKLTNLQADAGINVMQMTGMIAQTIGSIGAAIPDPRAKAATAATSLAVGTLGILTDQGLRIAGKVMDKFYGKDPSLLSMIEIFPDGYYTVDTTSGKVNVTSKWETDLVSLRELQKKYQPALQVFNDAYLNYTKEYNKALISLESASESEEATILANLTSLYDALKPLARTKVEIEAKLANLQLYRIALMRYNLPQLGTCGGVGTGPALLRLFVFLGAKQTNVYDITYCISNPQNELHANIEFVLPYFDNKGAYHDGGVKIVCPDNTINFQGLSASQDLVYGYSSTSVYNFYDTLLTAVGDGYEQYLVPFDIYKLRADIEAEIASADAQKDAAERAELTTMLNNFDATLSRANAEGFTSLSSSASDVIAAVDALSGQPKNSAEKTSKSVSDDTTSLSDIEEAVSAP